MPVLLGYKLPVVIVKDDNICHGEPLAAQPNATNGPLTDELYASYRRALGPLRFGLLRLVQASVLPGELRDVLRLEPHPVVDRLLRCYRFLPGGGNKLRPLHNVLLTGRIAKQLREMEHAPDAR